MTTIYEPIISPHNDLLTTEELEQTVQGYRGNLTRTLVENAPIGKGKAVAARVGYMSALYAIRMMSQPPAVYRSKSVAIVQAQINAAIRELEQQRQQ